LQVKKGKQFSDIGVDSKKCIEFALKNKGNRMSFGNLGRFFDPAKTADDKSSLEEFTQLSRLDQKEKILNLAKFIRDNGGLNVPLINDKNVHLWKKILEISNFLEERD
jgi:hypothetical protein